MIKTPVCELFGIEYPIFQGGMAWISDASSGRSRQPMRAGLGIISAMNADADYLVERDPQLPKDLTDKALRCQHHAHESPCG